nr:tetratricopeptide repeat protein [Candidatus Sigynarchaeota archaeon]
GVSDTLGEALCRVEAGNVLLLLGRTEEALEQFNTALRLSEKGGEQFGIAVALFHIGVSNIILGNDKGVVEAFERSMRTSENGLATTGWRLLLTPTCTTSFPWVRGRGLRRYPKRLRA